MTASHPCQSCNLCCDGTLFAESRIAPVEHDALSDLFALYPHGDGYAFAHPCVHSTPTGCDCYPDRPQYCRTFRCKSLIEHQASEIDLGTLRERIDAAIAARTALLDLAGGAASLQQVRDTLSNGNAEPAPELRLAMGVLELLLNRHFRTADMMTQVSPRSGSGRPVP